MAMIVFAVVALLVLGGLAVSIALMISPNTRVAGIVLLVIIVMAITLTLVGSMVLWRLDSAPMPPAMAIEQIDLLACPIG